MNKERLKHLVTILQGVNPALFNLRDWVNNKECGTICCALGWAAQDPEFNKQGLKMEDSVFKYPYYNQYKPFCWIRDL